MKKKIEITITGASYSGNKGAYAMLQSIIPIIKENNSIVHFTILSVYPKEDKKQKPEQETSIISCKPLWLIAVVFPLAILSYLFSWSKIIQTLLNKNKIINTYQKTDLVIDASGISYSDNRKLIMNIYAFIMNAVPILLKKDIIKYAQAIGPFKKNIKYSNP